jgi:hypothetical protein
MFSSADSIHDVAHTDGSAEALPPVAADRFDIRKLYDYQKRRSDHKKELYESLMNTVHHRIETVAKRQETQCFFQVPEFIVGKPLYDAYQCTGYMIQRLKDEGFVVQYAHPNTLYIDWTQHLIEPYVQEMERREHRRVRGTADVPMTTNADSTGTVASCPSYRPTGKLFGGNG